MMQRHMHVLAPHLVLRVVPRVQHSWHKLRLGLLLRRLLPLRERTLLGRRRRGWHLHNHRVHRQRRGIHHPQRRQQGDCTGAGRSRGSRHTGRHPHAHNVPMQQQAGPPTHQHACSAPRRTCQRHAHGHHCPLVQLLPRAQQPSAKLNVALDEHLHCAPSRRERGSSSSSSERVSPHEAGAHGHATALGRRCCLTRDAAAWAHKTEAVGQVLALGTCSRGARSEA